LPHVLRGLSRDMFLLNGRVPRGILGVVSDPIVLPLPTKSLQVPEDAVELMSHLLQGLSEVVHAAIHLKLGSLLTSMCRPSGVGKLVISTHECACGEHPRLLCWIYCARSSSLAWRISRIR
jgi:hypothetical protein